MAAIADHEISLDVYGPIEDRMYWKKCEGFISQNNLTVEYKGALNPLYVQNTMKNYHFFILPTLHENFGHVIVEALAAGCGLLISDQTPWKNLKANGIGQEIPITDIGEWEKVMRETLEMDQDGFTMIRQNVYEFVKREIDDSKEIQATIELFS
jgi:glycosyltransferase involved in cell wall biosynthesis